LPHFLDVLVERGGFRLQSFPFAGPYVCAKHFAFDSRALAFEMLQQFLIVLIEFADGSLDRAPRRDPVVPPFAPPSPHHAIMPQPLALAGLHPCQFVKKTVAVIPLALTQEGSRHAARDLLFPSVSANYPARYNKNDNQDAFFKGLLLRVGRCGANRTRRTRRHHSRDGKGARAVFAHRANREEVVVGRDAVEHTRHDSWRRVVYVWS
jgi:hypothetical protein